MPSPTDQKPATPQGRVRVLLLTLAAVAIAALIYAMWPEAGPTTQPSNQGRDARKPQATADGAASLEVRLDDLKKPPAASAEPTRNPFRFYVKPPPPPKPVPPTELKPGDPRVAPQPPPGPPPPPPITIKFLGVVEKEGTKWAIFSDGKGPPVYAKEGDTVLGQYKLLKIGVESVTMSYLDGKGVQQIPMRG